MNTHEVRTILGRLSGYWPSPGMTEEEVVAWTIELTSMFRMTTAEVTEAINDVKDREFRPRPGQMVGLVQGVRRRHARLAAAELAAVDDDPVDPVTAAERAAECRRILQGIGR